MISLLAFFYTVLNNSEWIIWNSVVWITLNQFKIYIKIKIIYIAIFIIKHVDHIWSKNSK